ncbi:NAD-dependent epimerase [Gammaproteobacteria bacterium]|nr:NAD-dependent epimerase [Gammaproteobacteria bacterium]
MRFLITGVAGFIGYHVAQKLLIDNTNEVFGLDNINDYYDINLKKSRLQNINSKNFYFTQADLTDKKALERLFTNTRFDIVINLAAQAGVRYSLTNPDEYIQSNIVGFLNVLEVCRNFDVKHLVYASSSSVYGLNESFPFSVSQNVDHPKSLYAASKKSNELMAHTYSHLFNLPTTGLRFFTVYGPWGRPDMALFLFTKSILNNEPIDVFNYGKMQRDFTYIDDIVSGIISSAMQPPSSETNKDWNPLSPDPSYSSAPYRVLNIGNNSPVSLEHFIECIEYATGKKANKNYLPIQPGDVEKTYADISHISSLTGYNPKTNIETGIKNFVNWYKDYYKY